MSDNSPNNESLEGTIAILDEWRYKESNEPFPLSGSKVRELCESVIALRLALAACEARENALLEHVRKAHECTSYNGAKSHLTVALSAPRDSEALRAFGEKCAEAGQKDAFDEISAMDAGVPRKQQDAAAIVARILSGGANG